MKYLILVTLIALIHWTNCEEDYGDDGLLFSYDEIEDRIDDLPKPMYKLSDAPELFKKFVKDFNKKYKDDEDYKKHYNTFVENLKEINMINSNKEYSSTADINLFTDLAADERQLLHGGFL